MGVGFRAEPAMRGPNAHVIVSSQRARNADARAVAAR